MRKVLFMVGSYLPNPSPNGICTKQIIDSLKAKGDKITCIAYAENNIPLFENIDGIDIYRVNRNYIDRKILEFKKVSKSQHKGYNLILRFFEILKKIKLILLLPIYPWNDIFYTIKLYMTAMKLHKEEKYDVVVSVHVPIDTIIVGYFMKKRDKSIKFITYFLDSLSGGFHLKVLSEKWAIQRRIKWEEKLLKNADVNIMMSSSIDHHRKYSSHLNHYKRMIFLDIPLLTDIVPRNKVVTNNFFDGNRIRIVYTGSLYYSSRNPKYILELFRKLNREDIALIFIGSSDCKQLFEDMQDKFTGEIRYYEHIEHDKIIDVLPDADFLLNIGVKNKNAISGKIFEYMSFGKPIISTYEIDEEPCIPYLEKYHPALLIDQRKSLDENLKILNDFIDKNYKVSVPFNSIEKEFYKNTPKAFIEVIDSLMGEDSE